MLEHRFFNKLLDEVDGWTNRELLRSVLNAGFRRGATVKRVEDGSSGYEIGSFLVFAPRALAGIGSKILDGTTRDRTFQFEMVRQMRDERRAKFRARTAGPEAKLITSEVGENRDSLDISAVLRRFGFETKSIRKG